MGVHEMLLMSVIPFIGMVISVGIAIYLLVLLTRLVRAVERIADKVEK